MQIVIDKQIIHPEKWKTDKLHVYALDYCCVGISPFEVQSWVDVALYRDVVDCKIGPTSIRFKLPDKLYGFYHLMQDNREYSLNGNVDVVLMVITSTRE